MTDSITSIFSAMAVNDAKEMADIAALKAVVNPTTGAVTGSTLALSGTASQVLCGAPPTQTAISCPANASGLRTYSTYDTLNDCKVMLGVKPTIAVAATKALAVSDSGSIVLVSQAGVYTISLPALSAAMAGTNYKFVNVSAAANIVTIDSGAAGKMKGSVLTSNGAAAVSAVPLGQQKVTFTATSVLGDFVEVWSDGTNWYANGRSTATAGLGSSA